jgi:hypothetical protein
MEKKTIVDELRAEVASIQKALNLIVSKIELYEAEMNVKETTQQATILGLKQTIAELQEKMLREKISSELKKEKEETFEEKGELIKEKGEILGGKGELIEEKGESFEGSGELIVEKGEELPTNSVPELVEGPELKQPIAASPSRDARVITDLRRAIGLNDRFRFKHDLFADNDQLMAETIDALNQINTMADADAYLKERFAWKADDATVVYFYEMLQRKFI